MPRAIAVLDRKLLRDVWEMKGQAVAIAAVVAAGVAMFVTYRSNFESLLRTRDAYYEGARFADVFASAKRAPASLEPRLAAIAGVEVAATRVVADVTLDIPGLAEPGTGRLISLPERTRPPLNDVDVRRGRWIDTTHADEVIANEAFVDANHLQLGDRVGAVINGRRRWLTIVGVGLSPEYVYGIRPGEMFPDKQRFGIFWMDRRAVASAFQMEGGFNDVALKLANDGSKRDVIAAVDRLLEPYGGRGAISQDLQPSAWTLDNELRQLQTFGFLTPLIFFSVAAFILNVAIARALALQRPQIAAMKALGYSNRAIAWHYMKFALVIAAVGGLIGVVAGAWLGSAMIDLYNRFFHFPGLDYQLSVGVAAASVVASLIVAAAGACAAVRRAVRIPPAEAMRPEAPTAYRASLFERLRGRARTTMATRMILRNLERAPMRSFVSIVGISFAVAVLIVGLAFIDVMAMLVDEQFQLTMRQDATLAFVEPRSMKAVYAVAHLPGVMDIEPQRSVAVRLRHGSRSRTLVIAGRAETPRLNRVVDRVHGIVAIPPQGLLMSTMLGDRLGVEPGQMVQVEVLEGSRPVLEIPVAALVDDTLGLQTYMHIDALHRLLREGDVVTGAALTLDRAQTASFYREVKLTPAVAGVALRELALQNFRETIATNMNLSIIFNVAFAAIIAFGVVYNAARVSLSERSRELASLRVLGFTRAEISLILLGELAILTVMALPLGTAIGYGLGELIMAGFNNEVYRISFVATGSTIAWSFLIVIAAAFVSGLVVRRRVDRLDLVAVLKTRE
jgi:putative ABC transport system permease protein